MLPQVPSQSAPLRCLCLCCVFVVESAGCSITPAQLAYTDTRWFTEYLNTHKTTQANAHTRFENQKCFIKVLPVGLLGPDILTNHRPSLNNHYGRKQRRAENKVVHSEGSSSISPCLIHWTSEGCSLKSVSSTNNHNRTFMTD